MLDDFQTALPEIIRRLVDASQPRKIILFGSRAKGNVTPDSDIDLLVIEDSILSKHQEIFKLRKALRGILLPFDILVATVEEFETRSTVQSTIFFWAKKEGRILNDANV